MIRAPHIHVLPKRRQPPNHIAVALGARHKERARAAAVGVVGVGAPVDEQTRDVQLGVCAGGHEGGGALVALQLRVRTAEQQQPNLPATPSLRLPDQHKTKISRKKRS